MNLTDEEKEFYKYFCLSASSDWDDYITTELKKIIFISNEMRNEYERKLIKDVVYKHLNKEELERAFEIGKKGEGTIPKDIYEFIRLFILYRREENVFDNYIDLEEHIGLERCDICEKNMSIYEHVCRKCYLDDTAVQYIYNYCRDCYNNTNRCIGCGSTKVYCDCISNKKLLTILEQAKRLKEEYYDNDGIIENLIKDINNALNI